MKAMQKFSAGIQVFAAAIFLFIISLAAFKSSETDVYVATWMYLGAAGLNFLVSVLSNRRGGVDFLVSFFFLFFVAVPAQVQSSVGVFPWRAQFTPDEIILTLGLLSLSQLSYAVGQAMSERARPTPVVDSLPSPNSGLFFGRWAIGIATFSLFCAVLAGPQNLLVARTSDVRDAWNDGLTQQMIFMARSTSLLAMVIMVYMARFWPVDHLRRQALFMALLFFPLFLVINYPPALPRFSLLGMLIAIGCLFVDFKRPLVKFQMSFAALFLLIFVFPVMKLIAREDGGLQDFIAVIGTADLSIMFLNVDFDAFMQTASTVQFLLNDVGDLRWGMNFLGVALFFVPRGLWPGKPIDTGAIVSGGLGYWFNNVASPLPAEALMGFGLLGPVIVFGLLGFFIMRIEQTANRNALPSFVLYAVLMGFIVIILRGALNGVAPQFASAFLVFGIMMLARRFRLVWRSG